MYDELLVPTDGSDEAEAAIAHAVDFARHYDAQVHVLYVLDTTLYSAVDELTEGVIEDLKADGKRIAREAADAIAADGVETETAVVAGGVHETIVGYTRENAIDLVVMGTHGRRGIDRYLHGSVAERVMRTTPAPLLTVRYTGTDASTNE